MVVNKKGILVTLFCLVLSSFVFFVGHKQNVEPKELYKVYLKGEAIGYIENKELLESYIDKAQTSIKEKYKVDKVYPPNELDIIKEVTYKVNIRVPEATDLQKLEKKSLVRYIYVGEPRPEFQKQYGKETRIQLDDSFAELNEIEMFIENERNAMKENEQGLLTVSIKADKETKMGIITDIKQALRRAQALKINYAAVQRTSY